jgi:hypothetical protein
MTTGSVNELRETRSVAEANNLLQIGLRLLEINPTSRGPIYILGSSTLTLDSGDKPQLPDR